MEVILLEKVENLGGMGDKVKVRSGYGRNFLLPQGKATLATPENAAKFEAQRAELEKKQAEELAAAQARATRLEQLELTIVTKAGTEGKLFGSVGTVDVADACTAQGVEVQRSEVRLPDGPIRTLGEHELELHLHADINIVLRVQVVGEDGERGPTLAEAAEAAKAAEAEASAVSGDLPEEAAETQDEDSTKSDS